MAIDLGKSRQDLARRLDLISKAWGRNRGYVFLAWIDRDEQAASGTRKAGFYEHAYHWPADREKMVISLEEHWDHDAYWCPSVFEFDQRKSEWAMEEQSLWADLDEVDPNTISDYPPTIAWETSPGRYQALWIIRNGDMLGASWPGGENQRLTYHLEADRGGWDTTQLLRIPGWPNHKLHYVKDHGKPPQGRLLWKGGRWYQPDDFDDLPGLVSSGSVAEDIVEDQIDKVDRDSVLGRVKLKLPKHIREYIYARTTDGQDRSSVLWQIERSLADAGCSAVEIVAVVRELVWNKYSGRHDEVRRLILEANKAVDQRPDEVAEEIDLAEEAASKPKLENLFLLVAAAKRPSWLIQNIWAEGSCGFIAGQPKSWKSWVGLDMVLSVASGRPFLDTFHIVRPRPVIYIQEEDSASLLKDRVEKMWPDKNQPRYGLSGDGEGVWVEPPPDRIDPQSLIINSLIRKGFTISDDGWMHWLASILEQGREDYEDGYGLMTLDPMMMVAGDVEENRAQDMTTKIFRPLKQLAEEYKVAVCLIHHMRKAGQGQDQVRGGQLMLGSMANHAWAEDSLYITHRRGKLQVEHESKHTEGHRYELSGLRKSGWQPSVSQDRETNGERLQETANGKAGGATRARARAAPPALLALQQLGRGVHTTTRVASMMGEDATNTRALAQLKRLAERGEITRVSSREWSLRKG